MANPRQKVTSFGCRLNSFEAEQIDDLLRQAGREDLLVVNSCAVTNETERQVKQKIRSLAREYPDKTIAVAGCAAELHPREYANIAGVSLVLGNVEKMQLSSYLNDQQAVLVGKTATAKSLDLSNFQRNVPRVPRRRRAEVMIQNGCDHDCTFCAITLARGDSRSVPADQVVAHIARLCGQGVPEVVLTGVDISAYGQDLPDPLSLGGLVKQILRDVPELPRLRLSSIDCIELDPQLIEAVASEQRLMPHLHLSLQAGDNMLLKRMKRRHNREQAIDLCQQLRRLRPDVVFGADLMVGFPTETREMYEKTQQLVEQCGLSYVHVFPFSPRRGTAAARIPSQVDGATRKDRAAELRRLGQQRSENLYRSLVGSSQSVLIETPHQGRTPQFVPVQLVAGSEQLGHIRQIDIIEANAHGVVAAPIHQGNDKVVEQHHEVV